MIRRRSSPQARILFAALLEQPCAWRHGYELSKQTGVKAGTLYPLLMRLSDQGLLAAEWREPEHRGRPPRHVYRLTPNGFAFASDLTRPCHSATLRREFAKATP